VIVVTSLHRDFVPSSWGIYIPTVWDWLTLLGTLGLFSFLLFLFIRGLPMISVHEMRRFLTEHGSTERERQGRGMDGREMKA
jgi:molybdopterin-containing oxidoreductase family membrane subunit